MTRKFFGLLLSLACALCLAACDDALSGGTESHQHNWSSYYLIDGEKYYQTCAGCDEKKYADSNDGKDLVLGVHIKSTDGFSYYWENGSWGVAGFDNLSDVTAVTIKEEYRGKPVTFIGSEAFSGYNNLKSVTIPGSITEILYKAFEGCTSLTSVTIPDGVTKIWSSTFRYCSSLTSVTIPNSVTEIGDGAFYGCSSLKTVKFKGTYTQWERINISTSSGLSDKKIVGDDFAYAPSISPPSTDGEISE